VSDVRESGAAAADPDRQTLTLTIRGGGEPHGVFSFDTNSLHSSVNASNTTLSLTVHRLAGAIGECYVSLAEFTGRSASRASLCNPFTEETVSVAQMARVGPGAVVEYLVSWPSVV